MTMTVLTIGTLDTKSKELCYLQQRIESEGAATLLMDISCRTEPVGDRADISCQAVATASGMDFIEIAELDKMAAVKRMIDGAVHIAQNLVAEKKCHAVIGLGGANGAEIACSVMRSLPVGFPKLMVTCVASGNVRPYVGTKDIMMLNSISDITLNRLTRKIIDNAALAIAHMARPTVPDSSETPPLVCISSFGLTQPCVASARSLLTEKGYEVVELHASGSGGMALEELVRAGEISGVLDLTTSELVDDLVGGMYSAGPRRLEAAAAAGIPQIISLGALDFGNFGPIETVPPRFRHRHFFFYAPSITLMRTDAAENEILGRRIAEKVNASAGPATVIIPLKGFSGLDRVGGKQKSTLDGNGAGDWHDPEANRALVHSLRRYLNTTRVGLIEMDSHINDPEFAQRAVSCLEEMMNEAGHIPR